MSVLTIENLEISHRQTAIVHKINLTIGTGEWLALVGESGSGKSITASSIGGLLPFGLSITSGKILLEKVDLMKLTVKEFQRLRGKDIAYIFQDYQGAFTPFITIGKQFDEMLKTHIALSKQERRELTLHTLKNVALPEERVYKSYPFQLSGGQLQRAAIAMAAILNPKLLIADEPTTALDSLTAFKILELIADLQKKTNCAVLFISHDLKIVRKYANKIAIMQNGEIVEYGVKEKIFKNPVHLYTKQLFAAIPPLKNPPSRLMTVNQEEAMLVKRRNTP